MTENPGGQAPQYYAGLGCRRGVDVTALRTLLEHTLHRNALRLEQLTGLASIDLKRTEPGLKALARELNLPLRFFSAAELAQFEHQVGEPSAIAQRETGVAGVAETSALAACGDGGTLVGRKYKTVAATCAVARGPVAEVVEPELPPRAPWRGMLGHGARGAKP